jgi:glycine betaine/proline transport system ATP-binding protein
MTLDQGRIAVDACRMTEVKLACEGVWKLFGPAAERFLAARDREPAPADLAAAGLIGAVQDASFAIGEGEIAS